MYTISKQGLLATEYGTQPMKDPILVLERNTVLVFMYYVILITLPCPRVTCCFVSFEKCCYMCTDTQLHTLISSVLLNSCIGKMGECVHCSVRYYVQWLVSCCICAIRISCDNPHAAIATCPCSQFSPPTVTHISVYHCPDPWLSHFTCPFPPVDTTDEDSRLGQNVWFSLLTSDHLSHSFC